MNFEFARVKSLGTVPSKSSYRGDPPPEQNPVSAPDPIYVTYNTRLLKHLSGKNVLLRLLNTIAFLEDYRNLLPYVLVYAVSIFSSPDLFRH